MKKIFFLAALAVSALVSAQTYDMAEFAFAESDITVANGTTTYNESKGYYEVKNTAGETVEMTIAQLPNMKFTYKNSAEKKAFVVSPNKYIQFDGDQRDLTISNLKVGDIITLTVASKGSTANSFEDSDSKGTALTGCIWAEGNKTQAAKNGELVFEDVKVQAIASTITIRTTAGGYCLSKIVIGTDDTAVENVMTEANKATKVIENGQLYIIKNGVKYNALGTVVAE
ncbi:MAG: hypothetical protein NC038_07825 [Paludibacter sp.]|nr:hypothetical protein [Bacteroidales bacterium]MCM1069262.1 hypothetical protein [Prevotella sp.]MCM1353755.1 hypothetical protein [Bacteroides sp.]MCM1442177.1 hypothetical protein [Muribaculum sp.]MCM1482526.1 hypothetical protein [Paludibacter sp.]